MHKKLLALIIGACLLGSAFSVSAQESVIGNQLKVSPDTIFLKRFRSERTQELVQLYQSQIEQYRLYEDQYITAKAEHQKLQTLSSLEQAVQATQRVMKSRTQVLITYFELLQASVDESQGIELVTKQRISDELTEEINLLKDHLGRIENSQDRDALQVMTDEFELLNENLQLRGYRALALLSISELQTVHDKSKLILTDIQAYHKTSSPSAATQARYNRAYLETERALLSANATLQKTAEEVAVDDRVTDRGSYTNTMNKLQPTFSQLKQVLGFLEELLRI